ncbi:hypothetical protein, partial [Aeromonas allosaccharophila]
WWSPLSSVGTYIRHFGTQMPSWGGATIPLAIEVDIGCVAGLQVHQLGRLEEEIFYLTQMSGHSTGQGKS